MTLCEIGWVNVQDEVVLGEVLKCKSVILSELIWIKWYTVFNILPLVWKRKCYLSSCCVQMEDVLCAQDEYLNLQGTT